MLDTGKRQLPSYLPREPRKQTSQRRSAVTHSFMLSRFCFFATNMQSELKSCTRAIVRRGPKFAAVRFYNRTADRQPHAHAFRFCREKCLEEMIQTLGFQSNPGVLYRDEDFVRS